MTTAWERFLDAPFPGDWQTFAVQAKAAALEDKHAEMIEAAWKPRRKVRQAAVEPEDAPLPAEMQNIALCKRCFWEGGQEHTCQVPGRCNCKPCSEKTTEVTG